MSPFAVIASLALFGTGCVIRAVPGPRGSAVPPPPQLGVGVSHEPAPPAAGPGPRMLTCDDAERIARDYAASHQLGPMALQNCHREERGSTIEVFLKGQGHGEKRHLKMRVDAHDGRVLDVKEEHEEHGEHGHGHGHGHDDD